METKTGKLAQVIDSMVHRAEMRPHEEIMVQLKRGLQITITFERRFFNLKLYREDKCPSRDEWETVLEHWPYKTFGQCLADQMHLRILHGQVGLKKE